MKSTASNRRLIVITYHFPPDGTIGGQRWAGLSKYLARLGWEVHVITAAPAGGEATPPGVQRHVVHRRRTVGDMYHDLMVRWRGASDAPPPTPEASRSDTSPPSRLNPFAIARRVASDLMHLPDGARGWVARAALAAGELMERERFAAVVSCGPPHSAHFAAWMATLGRATPFWIDMRDPWSVTHHMNLPDDPLILAERWVLRRMERLVFPRAARLLVNTREFATELRRTDPDLDVSCFPNGIDLELVPHRSPDAVVRGSIAYVGTLYAGRNLSMVLSAMRELLAERPGAAPQIRLEVAGPMEPRHREKMEAEIAAAGLAPMVRIHGQLPRASALDLLSRSHLALVLAQDQPMCVPAKLYECAGIGAPTLVIAEEDGAAAAEARRIGAMSLAPNDVAGMRGLLEQMLDGNLPITMRPTTPVSYADLAIEMDRLLREPMTAAEGSRRRHTVFHTVPPSPVR